jgi:murein DD-endopeptidase MepM/ murein hydrolase activator NlpD
MSKILVGEGDKVQAGDIIGKVGSTGRSTGPHLHYEVRRNGKPLNPVAFIKAGKAIADLL